METCRPVPSGRMLPRVLFAIFVFLVWVWLPIPISAATAPDSRLAGRAVVQVLDEALSSGIRVVYTSSLVPPHLTVQREPNSRDPLPRVREILASHGLTLESAGEHVWVVVRDSRGVIEGRLVDAVSGQALPEVTIHVSPARRDIRTQADGSFFEMGLTPGPYRLSVEPDDAHQGATWTIEVRAGPPTVLDLRLEAVTSPLSEITVISSRYSLLADTPQPSLPLGAADMANQPALLEDALRAVRRFPGTAGNGVSSRSYVRGGDANENLVLLDGVPVADPFHLEGLPADFSLIDPAWIEQLDFYSGVLPIEYGGRMSSVTHLKSRRARQPFGGRASLGLLNVSAMLEGTLPRADSDWLVAARRSTLDLVAEALERDYGAPVMTDAVAQMHLRTGPRTTVAVGALGAVDDVDLRLPGNSELTTVDEEQGQVWAAIDHEWNSMRALSRLTLSGVSQKRRGLVADAETVSGELIDVRRIRTLTLSQDWRMPTPRDVEARWGWFYARSRGAYEYRKAVSFPPELVEAFGPTPTGDLTLAPQSEVQSFGAYSGAEWAPFEDWRIDAGLRWERHLFDTGQRQSTVDPRISLLYQGSPRTRWRVAWGYNSQFPTAAELPVERGVLRYDGVARASLWVLGWDHEFSADRALRIELYDKRVENPWPRLESRIDPLVLVPELEPDHTVIAPDRAHMTGIDIHLRARLGEAWQGWLSYSGSRAYDIIAGRSERRSWDQHHALGVGLTTERWGWTWTGVLAAHSGWPTTPLAVSESGEIVLGPRNSARLPWYGTIDLRAQRTFPLAHGALRVSAELTNLTNRKNICCATLDFERDPSGALMPQVRRETKTLLPLVPFFSVAWEF